MCVKKQFVVCVSVSISTLVPSASLSPIMQASDILTNQTFPREDDLETCAICLEEITHLSLVNSFQHGSTSHAVHYSCGTNWKRSRIGNLTCPSCNSNSERIYAALAYYLRVIASITVNFETYKNEQVMDFLKEKTRTILGIYTSKNINVSTTLNIQQGSYVPSSTAEIEIRIEHPSFKNIIVPAELKEDQYFFSQHDDRLVLIMKDEQSTVATCVEPMRRKPKQFISFTEMLEGVTYPEHVPVNEDVRQELVGDPFCPIQLGEKFYRLNFETFEMERESQTHHVYSNKGLDELYDDEDVKSYLDSLPNGEFTILFGEIEEKVKI